MSGAWRTLAFAGLGLALTAIGLAVFIPRVALGDARVWDVAGIPLTAGGIVLVAAAFHAALRGRRRRAQVVAGVPAVLVLAQFLVLPVLTAGLATHAAHPHIPPAATLRLAGARDVTFRAADGVRLAGWFVPGRDGAAVVLAHGSHGDRTDTTPYLRFLAGAGYAVLSFDARGHGASGGATNALGWNGVADIRGAVDLLRRTAGIDPQRIGVLGLSMGAEEALRAAAAGVPVRAVVADGAGASTSGDRRLTEGSPLARSVTWLSMRAVELLSGDREPAPLARVSSRIAVPVLLISSNARDELRIDRAYRAHIGSGATLWHVADAGHTKAYAVHPDAYATRVTRFLASALAG